MAVENILESMDVLRVRFETHLAEWRRFKSNEEFHYAVNHSSPVQKLYEEGSSCAYYLFGALETRYVGESMLLDEYTRNVHLAIPQKDIYDTIYANAQADFEINYLNNYTVQYMLRQYVEQWLDVQRVKQFLAQLENSIEYRLMSNITPINVIQQYAREWEQDVQLHENLGETGLRSQLVLELKREGFLATPETHAHDGHADIIVSRPNSCGAIAGNMLVVECKIWDGPAALYSAVSQLCRYTTPYDDHAALVIFVRTGDFREVCIKAAEELDNHEACSERRGGSSLIEFTLTLPQDVKRPIPASVLLCNLTQPRYSRSHKAPISKQPSRIEVAESNSAATPAKSSVLNDALHGKFEFGSCKCRRCEQSSGSQEGYELKHTFEFNGSKIHRLFIATPSMNDKAIIALLKSMETSKG